MNIETIAVPALVVLVLTYVFQDVKALLERVPGIRPSDASHDDALRLVYGVIAFLAVLVYQLYVGGLPVDVTDWYALLTHVGATAVVMAVTGHYLYQKTSGGSSASPSASAPSTPADPPFPPGLPLATIQAQLAPAPDDATLPTPLAPAQA